jgi:ElaB/YqjD/DUF883 family membrane-anchored ribosome-binding protein
MSTQTDPIKQDIAELRAALEKIAKDVASVSESMAADLKDSVGRRAKDVKDGAQAVARDAIETGRQSGEAVAESVRQHPVSSLLIALGAGLVIGQLLSRNGSRH